nr:RHOMBOID-like protein 2 [Ipomoea batatas]
MAGDLTIVACQTARSLETIAVGPRMRLWSSLTNLVSSRRLQSPLSPSSLLASWFLLRSTDYSPPSAAKQRPPAPCPWPPELLHRLRRGLLLRSLPNSRPEKLVALEWNKIVNNHQGWRLFTCIWLHAGVVHLLANMLTVELDFYWNSP